MPAALGSQAWVFHRLRCQGLRNEWCLCISLYIRGIFTLPDFTRELRPRVQQLRNFFSLTVLLFPNFFPSLSPLGGLLRGSFSLSPAGFGFIEENDRGRAEVAPGSASGNLSRGPEFHFVAAELTCPRSSNLPQPVRATRSQPV